MTRHAAERSGWRNQAVVREPDRLRRRSAWRLLSGLVLALAPGALYIVQLNECLVISYELEALETARERLVKEEQQLKVERARLESLEQIERWALREGGLQRPNDDQVVVVREAGEGRETRFARARDADLRAREEWRE